MPPIASAAEWLATYWYNKLMPPKIVPSRRVKILPIELIVDQGRISNIINQSTLVQSAENSEIQEKRRSNEQVDERDD